MADLSLGWFDRINPVVEPLVALRPALAPVRSSRRHHPTQLAQLGTTRLRFRCATVRSGTGPHRQPPRKLLLVGRDTADAPGRSSAPAHARSSSSGLGVLLASVESGAGTEAVTRARTRAGAAEHELAQTV